MTNDLWAYRSDSLARRNLTGMFLEALDGAIGRVDETANDRGACYLFVETGPWVFRRRVLVPAGLISYVDGSTETVFADRTKAQIKGTPDFDENRLGDPAYREQYRCQVARYHDNGVASFDEARRRTDMGRGERDLRGLSRG